MDTTDQYTKKELCLLQNGIKHCAVAEQHDGPCEQAASALRQVAASIMLWMGRVVGQSSSRVSNV
jgi:hypothetical protein